MDLYVIRHAWAADRDDPQWADDNLRPLTAEGRKRFARMLEKLAGKEFAPQVIATSPLVRCRQTACMDPSGRQRCRSGRAGPMCRGLLARRILMGRVSEQLLGPDPLPDRSPASQIP